jgi:hypothetical protein
MLETADNSALFLCSLKKKSRLESRGFCLTVLGAIYLNDITISSFIFH